LLRARNPRHHYGPSRALHFGIDVASQRNARAGLTAFRRVPLMCPCCAPNVPRPRCKQNISMEREGSSEWKTAEIMRIQHESCWSRSPGVGFDYAVSAGNLVGIPREMGVMGASPYARAFSSPDIRDCQVRNLVSNSPKPTLEGRSDRFASGRLSPDRIAAGARRPGS
jgi:hypothetical protein